MILKGEKMQIFQDFFNISSYIFEQIGMIIENYI